MILFSEPLSVKDRAWTGRFRQITRGLIAPQLRPHHEKILLDIKITMFFGISAATSPRLQVAA
jgi:hypothetical protein